MKLVKPSLLFSIFVTFFLSCSISSENFPEKHELKVAIAKNIKIPFMECDTVIYNQAKGMCANSSQSEINKFFDPELEKLPYSKIYPRIIMVKFGLWEKDLTKCSIV